MKCVSVWETGAISTGISHSTSPQVTSTLTSRTIRPEGSDGNGSNDTLMEFDWNAHLSVPKMSTMHFLPFARITVAPNTSSTRGKNSRWPIGSHTLWGHRGILTLSVSHRRLQPVALQPPLLHLASSLYITTSEKPKIGRPKRKSLVKNKKTKDKQDAPYDLSEDCSRILYCSRILFVVCRWAASLWIPYFYDGHYLFTEGTLNVDVNQLVMTAFVSCFSVQCQLISFSGPVARLRLPRRVISSTSKVLTNIRYGSLSKVDR